MVLENSFPPDERVENEIDILLKNGFQITLVCTKKGRQNEIEVKDGLTIRRIPLSRFIYKSGALALELPFYFNYWKRKLSKILIETRFESIHLHDLPLAKVCASLSAKYNLTLVFDYHENRPEIMKMYYHIQSFPGKWLISVKSWLNYQIKETQKADRLILVSDEAKDYYIKNYGLDSQKLTVLPNYIALERFRNLVQERDSEPADKNNFTVVYFGDTGLRRGTLTILEAADRLRDKNIRFLIIGTSREQKLLEKESCKQNLKNVTFTGWVAPSNAMKMISRADAGICPFLRNIHHDTTYANKMFQYMALGKPVIVSDCTAQANFVKKENCGLVFEAGNPDELCDRIIELTGRKEYELFSRNAAACIKEKYNWEIYGARLIELYSGLNKA
ncbi:MAG: glycosyltransferase family 4 protein [Bacteroidales bacterium]|jgi:glycosyltransferase involved in cell wall biosynthesis